MSLDIVPFFRRWRRSSESPAAPDIKFYHEQLACPLFRLPPELRSKIYALLFIHIANTTITITFPSDTAGNAVIEIHPTTSAPVPGDSVTAILGTCKAISTEALEALYAKSLFILQTRRGHDALQWLVQPQSNFLRHIRNLELYVSVIGRSGAVKTEIQAVLSKLDGGARLKTLNLVVDAATEPSGAADGVAALLTELSVRCEGEC